MNYLFLGLMHDSLTGSMPKEHMKEAALELGCFSIAFKLL